MVRSIVKSLVDADHELDSDSITCLAWMESSLSSYLTNYSRLVGSIDRVKCPQLGPRVNIPSMDVIGYKDLMLSLVEVICGYPVTMDPDKNPFQKGPEDLSENIWYLVRSDQIRDSEAGFWMAKGEPYPMIFPNSPMICWEITRVFRERNNQETDWMMQEYNITITNGTFSICRIWKDHNHQAQGTRILPESDVFSGGDFLELLDLEAPLFPSSN